MVDIAESLPEFLKTLQSVLAKFAPTVFSVLSGHEDSFALHEDFFALHIDFIAMHEETLLHGVNTNHG